MKDLSKLSDQEVADYFNEDADNYYNDDTVVNASTLKEINRNPFGVKNEPDRFQFNLEFGSAVHAAVFEPDEYEKIFFGDFPDRVTKPYKDWKKESGLNGCLLKSDKVHADFLRDTIKNNQIVSNILHHPSRIVEKAFVKTINYNGHEVRLKCKCDCIIEVDDDDFPFPGKTDELWDLKTCEDTQQFGYSKHYQNISAYHYYVVTGLRMHYVSIEKGSGRLKVWRTDGEWSDEFYEKGKRAWEKAMNIYLQRKQPDFDVNENVEIGYF